jgi:hypothetical protein
MIISDQDVLNIGLHDSIIESINIDLVKRELLLCIVLNNHQHLCIKLFNIKKVSNLDFDINRLVILDYKIEKTNISLFTTYSEWIDITYEISKYELN